MTGPSKRITCAKCGWHLIVSNHLWDLSTWLDWMLENKFNTVDVCPKCGANEFLKSDARLLDSINPVEYSRKLIYMARRAWRLKKRQKDQHNDRQSTES